MEIFRAFLFLTGLSEPLPQIQNRPGAGVLISRNTNDTQGWGAGCVCVCVPMSRSWVGSIQVWVTKPKPKQQKTFALLD